MSKVDIIKKHIGSDDFYDLNGTEMLSKILASMEEYAEEYYKKQLLLHNDNGCYSLKDVKEAVNFWSMTNVEEKYIKAFFNNR